MSGTPKVSVLMPSLNVSSYIRECIESVINQTLKEIEIICIDAGSTDGTLEILQEYAEKDDRIQLILSDKKSYGYQMNLGLDAATGEYIGIVETDDYVKEDMYESLYILASEKQLDFVKADFYRFTNDTGELKLFYEKLSDSWDCYGKVINPQEDVRLFNLIMNTWSGIYSRAFLIENNIRHNETLGASYQDNGFWFQTFALAARVYFVDTPYYMNRRDNPNSSVHSKAKVYCMNEEYKYILNFVNAEPNRITRLMKIYCFKKYQNYMFTYHRIAHEFKLGYMVRMSEEFKEDFENRYIDETIFGKRSYNVVLDVINNPLGAYFSTTTKLGGSPVELLKREQVKVKKLNADLAAITHSKSYNIGRAVTYVPRLAVRCCKCLKEHGVSYTFKRFLGKLTFARNKK